MPLAAGRPLALRVLGRRKEERGRGSGGGGTGARCEDRPDSDSDRALALLARIAIASQGEFVIFFGKNYTAATMAEKIGKIVAAQRGAAQLQQQPALPRGGLIAARA